MADKRAPVMFIHGLWLHRNSWAGWLELFRRAGYDVAAPGWPNIPDTVDEARTNIEKVSDIYFADLVEHYEQLLRSRGVKPVVIGHGVGGLLAQKLLGEDLARAAVAICPVQAKGIWSLPLSQARVAMPFLISPAVLKQAVMLSPEQFRRSVTNATDDEDAAEIYNKWAIPGHLKLLYEGLAANFNNKSLATVNFENQSRGPLLLLSGSEDHVAPTSITKRYYQLHRKSPAFTDMREFPDRAHSLVIDRGWKEVANFTLFWLRSRNL